MFLHRDQIVQMLQTDPNSFWFKLFPKLKSQHPDMPPEEVNNRLMPKVLYLTLMQRPGMPDAVCFMPGYLLKSTGSESLFRIDLAFETAVQDVFDVQRGLKVAALKNVDPTSRNMSFAEATHRLRIVALLQPNEAEAERLAQEEIDMLQAKDISELLKGANIQVKDLPLMGTAGPSGVIRLPDTETAPDEQPPVPPSE